MNTLERLEQFDLWLRQKPGIHLAQLEHFEVTRLLPYRYFPVAAQFGVSTTDFLDGVNTHRKLRIVTPGQLVGGACVASDFHTLPFGHHTLDLAVLPHTLDFVTNPHALLRELTQVMTPDGHLLITGFQPFSLWGIRKWVRFPGEVAPWCGHFFSTRRIQDWLSLMGYRVRGGKMLMYRPPWFRHRVFDRLKFLEAAGDRWWPMLGAVYIIHAQLETLRMIPNAPALRRVRFRPRFSQPATRRDQIDFTPRKS